MEREKKRLRSISEEEQLSCPKCGERMRLLVDKVELVTENLTVRTGDLKIYHCRL